MQWREVGRTWWIERSFRMVVSSNYLCICDTIDLVVVSRLVRRFSWINNRCVAQKRPNPYIDKSTTMQYTRYQYHSWQMFNRLNVHLFIKLFKELFSVCLCISCEKREYMWRNKTFVRVSISLVLAFLSLLP